MRVDILFTLFVNNIVLFYFHNTVFRVSAKSGNSGKSGKSQGNAFCLKNIREKSENSNNSKRQSGKYQGSCVFVSSINRFPNMLKN